MNEISKSKRWYMKKRWWLAAALGLLIFLAFYFFNKNKTPSYESMTVARADLVQEVSVTGKVKPAQAVDLQFESSGRISSINYKVGDKVNSGAVIVSLENQDLQAAVTSARADLDKTLRNFNSLSDPSVSSSLRVELDNSRTNLDLVKKKADGDLVSRYSTAFNAMREMMTQIDTSSVVLEYIRKTNLEAREPWDSRVKQYQLQVSSSLAEARSAFPEMSGTAIGPASYSEMDLALQKILSAGQSLRAAFTYLQVEIQGNTYFISSSADRASVNTEAAAVSSDLSAVSAAVQGITDQRIVNTKNISDAEAKLATAEASFPTREDILQKEASLLSAQSQLRKSLIVAPFPGIIGKIDAERGETVNSSNIILSLISSADYQIEANVTEVDIGKVKVSNPAKLTLDSYGSQRVFDAVVSSIDTAATVVEGVTTYKVVFDFAGPVDEGIRPNMTANIDIETAKKNNIISIPQRAVVLRNGERFVRIFKGNDVPYEERKVEVGMTGREGFIEIIGGLNEGEQVITFVND